MSLSTLIKNKNISCLSNKAEEIVYTALSRFEYRLERAVDLQSEYFLNEDDTDGYIFSVEDVPAKLCQNSSDLFDYLAEDIVVWLISCHDGEQDSQEEFVELYHSEPSSADEAFFIESHKDFFELLCLTDEEIASVSIDALYNEHKLFSSYRGTNFKDVAWLYTSPADSYLMIKSNHGTSEASYSNGQITVTVRNINGKVSSTKTEPFPEEYSSYSVSVSGMRNILFLTAADAYVLDKQKTLDIHRENR